MQAHKNSLPPKLTAQNHPLRIFPSFQPVWKEWMGWKGDKKFSLKLLLSELSWEVLQKDILHSWSPGLQEEEVAREQVLQSLCVSLAAVKEVETPVKPTKQ